MRCLERGGGVSTGGRHRQRAAATALVWRLYPVEGHPVVGGGGGEVEGCADGVHRVLHAAVDHGHVEQCPVVSVYVATHTQQLLERLHLQQQTTNQQISLNSQLL